MKIKIGVMGSAEEVPDVCEKAEALGRAIAARDAILLTGATTGLVYVTGKAARGAGATHVGISPAHNAEEHVERYALPLDACDAIIYTGFGLKGRNVVLVRSCDLVIFISGSIGSLNEFTIAYDEGKVIGCLTGTGGVADEIDNLIGKFSKQSGARVFQDSDPNSLVMACQAAIREKCL
ncbi:MAG: SLOG cluster 4 domain-containing protein [Pyrinomonadaceae bacterium]